MLELYQHLSRSLEANAHSAELIEKIKAQTESADLEFVREEVPLAIDQAIAGADRVASIVRAMKEFSHPGLTERSGLMSIALLRAPSQSREMNGSTSLRLKPT